MGNPQDRAGLGDEGRHPAHLLSEVLTRNSSKVVSSSQDTHLLALASAAKMSYILSVHSELGLGQSLAGEADKIRSAG